MGSNDLIGYSPHTCAARLAEVGGALNPALAATSGDLGTDSQATWAARMGASGRFEAAASTRYRFNALSPAEREQLDRVLIALIDDEFGGEVQKNEDAVLHLARRR